MSFLKATLNATREIGMINQTGIGALTGRIKDSVRLRYDDIPHFAKSTVEGHRGTLAAGTIAGRSITAMEKGVFISTRDIHPNPPNRR